MHERSANLLGAVALTVADRLTKGAADAAGTSTSGAAALVTLAAHPAIGVTRLGEQIGLSQPATARMLDGLESSGLVERRRGPDGRSVAVHPTRSGRAAARRALQARHEALAGMVGGLNDEERAALTGVLERLLGGLYEEVRSVNLLCRLCDRGACRTDGLPCPVSQAARQRGSRDG